MKKGDTYNSEEIKSLCEEIERQWNFHLAIRSIFPEKVEEFGTEYESPSFYKKQGFYYKIKDLNPKSEKNIEGIGHWLNQNFVIRLFGILDNPGLIKAGKDRDNPFTAIVAGLRQKVGAHSSGIHNVKKGDAKEIQSLIHKHLDSNFSLEDLESFNLSINTVLHRLKNECIKFVRSMEGQRKPERSIKDKNCINKSA